MQKINRDKLIRAAEISSAHEFISQQSEGYETEISEGGGNFSGGEKQKITLARAFYKDAPIILLDEVTSALDGKSEEDIKAAIEKIKAEKTILMIAHRASTIDLADKIILLENGRIIETLTKEEWRNKYYIGL